jgi:hypothetical protein
MTSADRTWEMDGGFLTLGVQFTLSVHHANKGYTIHMISHLVRRNRQHVNGVVAEQCGKNPVPLFQAIPDPDPLKVDHVR